VRGVVVLICSSRRKKRRKEGENGVNVGYNIFKFTDKILQ
jgi:hypothetical protein